MIISPTASALCFFFFPNWILLIPIQVCSVHPLCVNWFVFVSYYDLSLAKQELCLIVINKASCLTGFSFWLIQCHLHIMLTWQLSVHASTWSRKPLTVAPWRLVPLVGVVPLVLLPHEALVLQELLLLDPFQLLKTTWRRSCSTAENYMSMAGLSVGVMWQLGIYRYLHAFNNLSEDKCFGMVYAASSMAVLNIWVIILNLHRPFSVW